MYRAQCKFRVGVKVARNWLSRGLLISSGPSPSFLISVGVWLSVSHVPGTPTLSKHHGANVCCPWVDLNPNTFYSNVDISNHLPLSYWFCTMPNAIGIQTTSPPPQFLYLQPDLHKKLVRVLIFTNFSGLYVCFISENDSFQRKSFFWLSVRDRQLPTEAWAVALPAELQGQVGDGPG